MIYHFMGIKFKKMKLSAFAALMSLATALMFHFPFYRYILDNVDGDFNGAVIVASLTAILFIANYFAFYLVLWLGRIVGRILSACAFVGNSITLYFINTYDVIIDDTMMGNVFNTNYAEATSYWSVAALLYIVLMGVIPAAIVVCTKIDFGSFKRFAVHIGTSLALLAAICLGNMSNWMWIDKNSTVMGSLILPWSYVVNTFRYYGSQKAVNRQEIPLPNAVLTDNDREVMVLVIGESARRDHFSLYGYDRQTNPLLEKTPGVRAFKANSAATYTTAGVKAILSYKDTDELYEILPNYLYRNGVEVIWRTSNWGQPPLHIDNYREIWDIADKEGLNPEYDENLLYGLWDEVRNSAREKVLVVLHTSISHGPSYDRKYPLQFRKWTPVPETVEMSKCPVDQLVNAYDNGILYTDSLLSEIIDELKALKGYRTGLIYVSDHGESLGENGLYMHGVPISIAPSEQYEIPFIIWTSDGGQKYKDSDLLSQYHVFHSTLRFFGVSSPIYNEELDIFK